jgi:secondary thiamine-phosphate synthase enzyme
MEFSIESKKKTDVIDITAKVRSYVENRISEGTCLVYVPHTTAAIVINEYEPLLEEDMLSLFERIVPKVKYKHDEVDNNAAAHLKSVIFGTVKAIPIIDGKLTLGDWQSLLFCEFDGPRKRKVILQIK